MKFYTSAIKALTILLGVLAFNTAWAGDDEFSVTVTEKVSGPIKEYDLCLDSNETQQGYQVPSYTTDQNGLASPTFNIDFVFDDIIPAIATQFEVRAFVFTKDAQNNLQPLTPSNATSGTIYTTGSSGTVSNGTINLSVTPEFNVLSNCEYYFRFWLVDITPQTPTSGGENEENNNSSITTDHSLLSPLTMLTKDASGCTRYVPHLCITGTTNQDERIGFTEGMSTIKAFPNPAVDGQVLINLNSKSKAIDQELRIQLLNMQGQVLKQVIHNFKSGSNDTQIKMNLEGIPSGIYLIRATEKELTLFDKLIIN